MILCAGILASTQSKTEEPQDALIQGFSNPPREARPASDLDTSGKPSEVLERLKWLKRLGTSQVTLGEVSFGAVTQNPESAYLTHDWRLRFTRAVEMADSLGITSAILTSPGWSHTGGPWVQPRQAMKKLVWSRTVADGGTEFRGYLPQPPRSSGPFQGFAYRGESSFLKARNVDFYRDVQVVAYPIQATTVAEAKAVVTFSAGSQYSGSLEQESDKTNLELRAHDGQAWVQIEYKESKTIRSAVLATPEIGIKRQMRAVLAAKDEQGTFQRVAVLDMLGRVQATVSFAPVRSTTFRFSFERTPATFESYFPLLPPHTEPVGWYKRSREVPVTFPISRLELLPNGLVNEFERKAGFFAYVDDYSLLATKQESANDPIKIDDVINLTDRMRPDGFLSWKAPPGRWAILRFGYSLTGKVNYPAGSEATGLEVDKLSREHVRAYLSSYLNAQSGFLPSRLIGKHGVGVLFADSIESGPQNWTERMLEEFQRRRGYDPRSFLPVLTGIVVGSAKTSDQFLWDFRRTIAELIHENLFGTIAQLAHERGLEVHGEALEFGRLQLGDDMEMRRYTDVPIGAMWATYPLADYLREYPNFVADQRGAASVAHIYGQKRIGAEPFTNMVAPWGFSPRLLRPIADLEFALGVNWLSGVPSREDTWAEQAQGWELYLARCSWLLQQGQFVADIAYFYGEDAPLVSLGRKLDDVPLHYGFDFINADAILKSVTAREGYLHAPSGARYRAVQLGANSRFMTLPVLQKLREFVRAGVLLVGDPPIDTPSHSDDPYEYQKVRNEIWSAQKNAYPIYASGKVEEALAAEGVHPDLVDDAAKVGKELLFSHRSSVDGELYFLTNRTDTFLAENISFRSMGKAPELWQAATGEREEVPFRSVEGRTVIPLRLPPYSSAFVVFRKSAAVGTIKREATAVQAVRRIEGPWSIRFQQGRGAPADVAMPALDSWTKSKDLGIRYFSGSAWYSHSIELPRGLWEGDGHFFLDLGDVRELAEVFVNGESCGVVWSYPYRVDISAQLHAGKNTIQVKVTNLWVNHLVGRNDPHAPIVASSINTGFVNYTLETPLRPSGLLGPVKLLKMAH